MSTDALFSDDLPADARRLRIPDQGPHRSALVAEVREALERKTGAQEALDRAAGRWAELDRKKGPAATKAEYLLSLGLLAR